MRPLEEATRFLEALWGPPAPDKHFELRPIKKGGAKPIPQWFTDARAAARAAVAFPAPYNAYCGVNPRTARKGDKEHVAAVSVLWVDQDDKCYSTGRAGAITALGAFPFAPSLVVDSGGGRHLYWLLAETMPTTTPDEVKRVEGLLERLYGRLGTEKRLDSTWDLPRILRVPGTLNYKEEYGEPVAVRLLEHHPERRYTFEQFEALLPVPTEPERPAWTYPPSGAHTGDIPTIDEVRELLRFIASHGDYKLHWIKVLAAVHSVYPGPEGITACEEWSPGTPGEIEKCFSSFKRAGSEAATAGTLYYLASQGGWRRPQATLILSPTPQRTIVAPPVAVVPPTAPPTEDDADALRTLLAEVQAFLDHERLKNAALEQDYTKLAAAVDERDKRIAKLEAENAQLHELESLKSAVSRNTHIKQHRGVALAALNIYASAQSRGALDDQGFVRLPNLALAEVSGVSEACASKKFSDVAAWGIFEKQTRPAIIKVIDQATGEITETPHPTRTENYFKPRGTVLEASRELAVYNPAKETTWGGKREPRPRCDEHPHAGTIERKTIHCAIAECDKQLGEVIETYHAPDPSETPDPGVQDEHHLPSTGHAWAHAAGVQDEHQSKWSTMGVTFEHQPREDAAKDTGTALWDTSAAGSQDDYQEGETPSGGLVFKMGTSASPGRRCCAPCGCQEQVKQRLGHDDRPAWICNAGHDQARLALSARETAWNAVGGTQ